MTDKRPNIDIIIVNWNSKKQLYNCLASIEQIEKTNFNLNRVCVVDNGSIDNSLSGIEALSLPFEIIINTRNKGFSAAVNQGTRSSISDYLLLLNPDTRLQYNSISKPIQFLEDPQSASIAIVGIQNVDDFGNILRTCARFPTPKMFIINAFGLNRIASEKFRGHFMWEWDHQSTRIVNHVIGAFFLVRNNIWQQLGGFDERFFMYFEDIDFSQRVHAKGFHSVYLSGAQVYHRGGGTSEQVKSTRLFYSLKSCLYYAKKHFGENGFYLVAVAVLAVEPLTRLAWATFRFSSNQMVQTIKGYIMLYRELLKKGRRTHRFEN
jgi:GT2 family glycosyltransferase